MQFGPVPPGSGPWAVPGERPDDGVPVWRGSHSAPFTSRSDDPTTLAADRPSPNLGFLVSRRRRCEMTSRILHKLSALPVEALVAATVLVAIAGVPAAAAAEQAVSELPAAVMTEGLTVE